MREVSEAERKEWGMSAVTAALVARLRTHQGYCQREVLMATQSNDEHTAKISAGKSAGIDDAIAILEGFAK